MATSALTSPAPNPTLVNACILAGSVIFVFCLLVSAVFVPELRVLHALQALIYVAIVVLTRRRNPWGFGAGIVIAAFWNYAILFASPIGRQAIQALGVLFRTGHLGRADGLLQLFAASGHALIIVACLVGFLRLRPSGRQWGQFAGGGAAVIGYLVGIVLAVAPPEIVAHLREAFGL